MTDTRPFDPALFHDTAIDPETAHLNAQMIELLTGQPEWWIVGTQAARAARRRARRRPRKYAKLAPGAVADVSTGLVYGTRKIWQYLSHRVNHRSRLLRHVGRLWAGRRPESAKRYLSRARHREQPEGAPIVA